MSVGTWTDLVGELSELSSGETFWALNEYKCSVCGCVFVAAQERDSIAGIPTMPVDIVECERCCHKTAHAQFDHTIFTMEQLLEI